MSRARVKVSYKVVSSYLSKKITLDLSKSLKVLIIFSLSHHVVSHAQARARFRGILCPPEHNSALSHAKYEFCAALLTFFSALLGTFQKMGIVRRHSLSLTTAR